SLPDAKVHSIKPSDKPFKLTDSHGLYLLVNPGGSRLWYLNQVQHLEDIIVLPLERD
ncbi:DUF4102 domain-containing protein, partial [Salmonella enterica subsp. salamae serovar Sofia]|nr:DUF4102 domain-containing protein [Salmonella enterica subsp. salamae serovar Sofia]